MGIGKIAGYPTREQSRLSGVVSPRTKNRFSLAAALGYYVEPFEGHDGKPMLMIYRRSDEPETATYIERKSLWRYLSYRHRIELGDPELEWNRDNLLQ